MSNDENNPKNPGNTGNPNVPESESGKGAPGQYEDQMARFRKGPYPDGDEVDPVLFLKTVWEGRKTILYSLVLFIFLGLFIALGSQQEFTSRVKLMPEAPQESIGGGLGGIARQFGLGASVTTQTDGIPAYLYPDITSSLPLMQHLMHHEVYIGRLDKKATVYDYFTELNKPSAVYLAKRYTIGLPFTILSGIRDLFREEVEPSEHVISRDPAPILELVRLSRKEWEVNDMLRERITTEYREQSGVVQVSVEMPDPEMAGEIAQQVIMYLVNYIEDYRTEKTAKNVDFLEERHKKAQSRFQEAQEELARFRDENRGQLTEMARTREQQLQSEYDLTFNIYNSMAERLEEARIRLQEETPVVKVLEPANVPNQRSSPRRLLILLLAMVMGGATGMGIVFGKQVITGIRKRW